jgi:hypothetical protein
MSERRTKRGGHWTTGATLALAALLLAGGTARAEDAGRLADVRGAVEVGSGEPARWHPAREGEALAPGDRIRTGLGGRVEVELRTGRVRLYEASLLVLPDAPATRPESERVRVESGTSLFDVLRRSDADRFEVETPEVAVMVKGTRFEVAYDGSETAVSVWRGLVGVRGMAAALEHEVLVRPGFATSGDGSRAFELVVNPAADPWEAWSKDLPPPPAPSADARPLPGDSRLALAREAARDAARADLARELDRDPKLARRLADRELRSLDDRADDASPPASRDRLIDPRTDPQLDDSRKVRERLVESTLNGATGGSTSFVLDVVTSGDPNVAVITGPGGVTDTLTQSQVENMLQTGNTSGLSPGLLNQLTQMGTDPLSFLQDVSGLLRDDDDDD